MNRLPLILFPLFLVPSFVFSQACQGNLGDNIFFQGDFGAGIANVLPNDPGIAPGYIYTNSPPPFDGFYTITNSIGVWNETLGWLEIGDNSISAIGYMMVVNASLEPGLFYEQQVSGLCENTQYTFSADIINVQPRGMNFILPNVSFLLDGNVVLNTGDIPENEEWITYSFTFPTAPGQTSLTLALQNNAPGGFGNDLALDNISFRPCGPAAVILPGEINLVCEDQPPLELTGSIVGSQYDTPAYQWQQSTDRGNTWTDIPGATSPNFTPPTLPPGDYYYRFLLANDPDNLSNFRCRVNSNEVILRVIPKFVTFQDTLCEGLAYPFGNQSLTSSGSYEETFQNSLGCDSIVTLELTLISNNQLTAAFQGLPPSCEGSADGSIVLDTFSGGTPPFIFFLDGDILESLSLIDNLTSGTYSIGVTDRFGCQFDTVISLQEPPPLEVELGQDQSVELGETVELFPLTGGPIDQFLWQPDGLVACEPNCISASLIPPRDMVLSLTVQNDAGCERSDSIFIEVEPRYRVFFPNGFTPNGDRKNDFFTVIGDVPAASQVEALSIYNRWGRLIWENQNFPLNVETAGWGGTVDGDPAPEGVYVWVARIRFLDDQVDTFTGSLVLFR
ncbi:MAG: gliding motility-associated C-terminal domain-containing protein [Bacteroidota bacterium]